MVYFALTGGSFPFKVLLSLLVIMNDAEILNLLRALCATVTDLAESQAYVLSLVVKSSEHLTDVQRHDIAARIESAQELLEHVRQILASVPPSST